MIMLWVSAMAMTADYPYPLDPKQGQQAEDIWRGLQGKPQTGPYLIDRMIFRETHGSEAPTIVSLEQARRDTQGCSITRISQEAPESLSYQLNCHGQQKYLYFAASDGTIILISIDNRPGGVVVVTH